MKSLYSKKEEIASSGVKETRYKEHEIVKGTDNRYYIKEYPWSKDKYKIVLKEDLKEEGSCIYREQYYVGTPEILENIESQLRYVEYLRKLDSVFNSRDAEIQKKVISFLDKIIKGE